MVVTVFAWQASLRGVEGRTQVEFDRQADHTISLFEHQLERYADVLRSSAGFVIGSDEVRPDEWRRFTQRIALKEQFPAFEGLGVVYRVERSAVDDFIKNQRLIRPEFTLRPALNPDTMDTRQYVMPITLVAPEQLEQRMPGFDIAHEALRRDAIERSIKTGTVQITGPIRPDGADDNGFVLISPIFDKLLPETEAHRQAAFVGVVVAAVVTKNLVEGVLNSKARQVALRVSDGSEVVYNELIAENPDVDSQPLLTTSEVVQFYGREWRFDLHSTKSFRLAQTDLTPTLVLVGGLIFNIMLILLLIHMSRTHRRLDRFGKEISHKYELQSKALQERNDQLETFSHMASHDLKGPLRAIDFLSQCMKEDIEENQPNMSQLPQFSEYIERIKSQVALGQGLIKGILQYAEIEANNKEPSINQVNVLELLESLRVMLAVDESQLQLIGEFPTFDTYQTQLTQVLMNLIGNGFKYHHGQGTAVVTVSVETSSLENFYCFSVRDNGSGISSIYHEKIFEPFTTLQPKDHSMSSGVGLAIVKKLVTQHGGMIEIISDADQGACFSFDWPCSITDPIVTDNSVELPKAA